MALAAESNQTVVDGFGTASRINVVSLIARTVAALGLMAVAANCFLKYLWWAANSSAWRGIPKYADRWQTASTRASFYGWSLVILDLAGVLLVYSVMRFRQADLFRNVLRIAASLIITVAATGLLALVLSWIKQSTP